MVTDGEPTAHIEGGEAYFQYPPSPVTIEETLKEVMRCTRDGIRINTFMLDESYYLKSFVERMMQLNRGRAFFTTPDTLGDYVLVDFLEQRRRTRRAADARADGAGQPQVPVRRPRASRRRSTRTGRAPDRRRGAPRRADRDGRGRLERVAEDAGADGRERDRRRAELAGDLERPPVGGREELGLAGVAAVPHRPDRVDDRTGRGARNPGVALASPVGAAPERGAGVGRGPGRPPRRWRRRRRRRGPGRCWRR